MHVITRIEHNKLPRPSNKTLIKIKNDYLKVKYEKKNLVYSISC